VSVTVHHLGRVEYDDGLRLQALYEAARKAGTVGDTLMLLEHPAVLTKGRGAKAQNLLAAPETLARLGVEVHETDRGGDITYHGPGQIVGYPLLHLGPGQQDVRRYVRRLEETIIRTLAHFGLTAGRRDGYPGVWIDDRKIAQLGVHLSRWYTRHGFALNVAPNLQHFELIVPCGIAQAKVTSMAVELGAKAPSVAEVEKVVAEKFGEVFETPMLPGGAPAQTVSVVVRRGAQTLALKRAPHRGSFWQIVTGRFEPGETPADAAAREAREETGAQLVGALDYVHMFALEGPVLVREHAFMAQLEGDPRLSDEHDDYEWLSRDEAIARMPFAGLKEAIRRAYR
jgi:lipoyl(octanoyl) transferase